MFKVIHLTGEEFGLQIDRDSDSEFAVVRLNDFVIDEEKSTPSHTFYKENKVLEVYPTVDEIKEMIKALQQILPEEDVNE